MTIPLIEKYGDKLINVRYIYDPDKKQKLKTVELIEEAHYWNPS